MIAFFILSYKKKYEKARSKYEFLKIFFKNFFEKIFFLQKFTSKCAIFHPNLDYLIFDEYSDIHMSDTDNVGYVFDLKMSDSDVTKIVGFGSDIGYFGYPLHH